MTRAHDHAQRPNDVHRSDGRQRNCYTRWFISISMRAASPPVRDHAPARAGNWQEDLSRGIDNQTARRSRRSHQCAEPDREGVADAASDCALAARGARSALGAAVTYSCVLRPAAAQRYLELSYESIGGLKNLRCAARMARLTSPSPTGPPPLASASATARKKSSRSCGRSG